VRFDLVAGDDLGIVGNAIAMPVEEHDVGGFGVPAVAGRVVPPTALTAAGQSAKLVRHPGCIGGSGICARL
jgi:hypothetical protein